MQTEPATEIKPALLTKSEIQWLLGKKQVSKSYAGFMKSSIKSKLKTFLELELPLLESNGYSLNEAIRASSNGISTNSNVCSPANGMFHIQDYLTTRAGSVAQSGLDFSEENFIAFLKNSCGHKAIKERVIYAKRFCHVLDTGNAADILSLKDDDRNRVMKALALLSKFQGRYDQWKLIRQKYDLKWASQSGLSVFNQIMNNDKASYSPMLTWIKDTIRVLPASYGNIIQFAALTGLRANEAIMSLKLIRSNASNYVNNGVFEHYRYPDLFIRRTKKAFISIANENIVSIARSCQDVNYDGFRAYLKRRRYSTNLGYCRKLFATHLRQSGVETEIIDLLQGRVPKSVFARHYFRPDFNPDKIRKVLDSLYETITS